VTLFLQGGGANGKSTILNAIQASLGSYARGLLATVLGGQRDQHPTELMDLWGCRLAFMEETGDGHRLDTTKLKRIVGTGTITARRMYKDSVSFNPTHTLAVTTNHRPLVTDVDHGTWRRLALVPFPYTYGHGDGDRTADGNLRSRLGEGRAQQEAVLAWIVCGAHDWWVADCRLPQLPDIVVHATQAWREEGDPLFAFIESRLTARPDGFAFLQEMLENFNDSLDKPHNPWGMVTFAQRLEGHPALKALGAVPGQASPHPQVRVQGGRVHLTTHQAAKGAKACSQLSREQPYRKSSDGSFAPFAGPCAVSQRTSAGPEACPNAKKTPAPADPKVGGGQGSCGERW